MEAHDLDARREKCAPMRRRREGLDPFQHARRGAVRARVLDLRDRVLDHRAKVAAQQQLFGPE